MTRTATATRNRASGGKLDGENELEIVAEHHEDEDEHAFELDTDEVCAGWTTITFDNRTEHTHFAQLVKLPQAAIDGANEDGIGFDEYYDEHIIGPFQWFMDDIDPEKEPDPDDLSDKYSNPEEDALLPPWFEELLPAGGPGLTAGEVTSTTTVELEPGEYVVECYVKDEDGKFHGYLGMLEHVSVTEGRSGEEPEATLDLSLSTDGIALEGDVRPGQHTVAIHFEDQQTYENLVGHDAHLIRLDATTSVEDVNGWMNWMDPAQFVSDGTEPGTFLGGVQNLDTPGLREGGEPLTAYFHANLNPGAYAWVAEVPNPAEHGLLETFSVSFDDAVAIDPVFGYPTTDPGNLPGDLEPDHEVQLLAAPPAGPDQPFFVYFEPTGLHVDTGDVVQFTAVTPDHTVTAMHPEIGPGPRVPEGSSPFSSPVIGPGMAWFYRFEQEGVYDIYCGPHFLLGMVMRLIVGDIAEEDLPEYARTVEGLPTREELEAQLVGDDEEDGHCEWPAVLPAEVLGTDALDPMNIQETGAVTFDAVVEELGYEFQPPGAEGEGGEEDDGE